jgi:hypothetical protein
MYIFNLLSLIWFFPVAWNTAKWISAHYEGLGIDGAIVFFVYLPIVFNCVALLWGKTKWIQLVLWGILFHWYWHMGFL